jgi:hypothetical protein
VSKIEERIAAWTFLPEGEISSMQCILRYIMDSLQFRMLYIFIYYIQAGQAFDIRNQRVI